MRAQPRVGALRAACIFAVVSCAAACTQVILGGQGMAYPTEAMSARTFDFRTPAQLILEVSAVPANFPLTGIPGTPAAKDFPQRSKYGVVCQVANTQTTRDALTKYVGDRNLAKRWGGLCYDGLNEAGLSGAYLWDTANQGYSDVTTPPTMSTADTSVESVSYFDYPLRVLSACDTVTCAKTLTQQLVIVNRPMLVNVSQYIVGMDFIPMHATFCDKTAACISVEWGPGGVANIADLPHGVFANAPPLPEQESRLADYDAASLNIYGEKFTDLNWPGGLASVNLTFVNSSRVDSNTRYIRAARLRRLFGPNKFIDLEGDLSPAKYGTGYAAFAQINAMSDHIKIAGAYPSGYAAYWEGEMTVVTSVRDHKRGEYCLRISSNMNSHCFNVFANTRGGRTKVRATSAIIPQRTYFVRVRV